MVLHHYVSLSLVTTKKCDFYFFTLFLLKKVVVMRLSARGAAFFESWQSQDWALHAHGTEMVAMCCHWDSISAKCDYNKRRKSNTTTLVLLLGLYQLIALK